MSEVNLEQKIEAPTSRMSELVRTASGELGWHVENIWLNQLSAVLKKTQRLSGLSASYEYRLLVKWGEIIPNKSSWVRARVTEQEDRASADSLADLASALLVALEEKGGDLEEAEATAKAPETYGSARWAQLEDFEKAGYVVDKPPVGCLVIGPAGDGRIIAVPRQGTLKHALVLGPTGSGKSSKVIKAQAILRLDESMVITEATPGNQPPDVYSTTATWRARMGQQKIIYFNPDDLSSNQINPLDQVTTTEKAIELANLIVENTGGKPVGNEKMWVDGEKHLLTALLIYAKGENGHLGMVRNFMKEGPEGIGRLINSGAYEEAISEYKLFINNTTEGIRNGIASGLLQRLNLWVNPKTVKLTEKTDFNISDLLNEKFTFYLAVPAHKRMVKPLAALVFNYVLNIILAQKPKYPVSLVLDEFTNFGKIENIENMITIIRQREIPMLFGCQNYLQLKKVYGLDDAGILYSQTSSKFMFRAQDLETAKRASDTLGRRTIVERKMSSSGHLTEREFGRPLMEVDELMNMQDLIVSTPDCPPFKTKGFTWQDFTYATTLPPYETRLLEIDDRLTEVCKRAAVPPSWDPGVELKLSNEEDDSEADDETPIDSKPPVDAAKPIKDEAPSKPETKDVTEPPSKVRKSPRKPRAKERELDSELLVSESEADLLPEPEQEPDAELEPVEDSQENFQREDSPEYDF